MCCRRIGGSMSDGPRGGLWGRILALCVLVYLALILFGPAPAWNATVGETPIADAAILPARDEDAIRALAAQSGCTPRPPVHVTSVGDKTAKSLAVTITA